VEVAILSKPEVEKGLAEVYRSWSHKGKILVWG
jgi:hypothetical protein